MWYFAAKNRSGAYLRRLFRGWCGAFCGLGHPNLRLRMLIAGCGAGSLGGHGWCCCGAETSLFTSSFCILGNELFRPAAILWHSSLSPFCVDFGQVFVFVVFLGCPLITRHRGRHKGACPERTYRLLPLPLHSLRPPQPPHIFLRSYSLFVIVFVRGERAKQNWR